MAPGDRSEREIVASRSAVGRDAPAVERSVRRAAWEGVLAAAAAVATATAVSSVVLGRHYLADVVMVYLLGTVLVSLRYGYGPSIGAAVTSVLCFNFFFIPPYHTFAVADPRHLVTFAVMFGVAVIISGLTRRVRDESHAARRFSEEAKLATARAETEQLRSALLSSVSHDLRTPLAIIKGSATAVLDERVAAPARREMAEAIVEEADRLNRLVQNLLDMTRLEAGALVVHREWHALEEVIGSALARVEGLLTDRPVETEVAPDVALVPIDAVLVEQALVNLLENAAKHTPAGTPIALRARRDGDAVEVEIADRGEGISPDEAERVFDKFYRGRSDRRGSGLGLTICKGIVSAHGGRIWVEPHDGAGLSVRFTLPIEGEPPALVDEREEATS
ncbi:MAG: DUF4118 domain-containing protein [Polyangiaceae bacterium]